MGITIKDIAKQANVSVTTVSLVMNNKADHISEKTKQKIFQVVEEMDYKPSQVARSLVTSKSKTIALIVPDISNPFFSEIAKGISDVLYQEGYNLFLSTSYDNIEQELQSITSLAEYSIDGLIISTVNTNDSQYEAVLSKLNIPLILLDRHSVLKRYTSIGVADKDGGYQATQYLLDKGHKQIACITGNADIRNLQERLAGYREALEQHGVAFNEKLVEHAELTIEGGYMATKNILEKQAVSAIFACNDLMALGVYQAALERGLKIPEHLSVVGFDDIPLSKYLNPKLTTMHQPIYQIGTAAANSILAAVIDGKTKPEDIVFDLHLVERDSVSTL
ncbi:LacI family DNA-binding transcriptional regulator [Culicoidibacter larvae]|nr:LacI family DNA-binding transcriptional regulator [Culicoidibacter larvae]